MLLSSTHSTFAGVQAPTSSRSAPASAPMPLTASLAAPRGVQTRGSRRRFSSLSLGPRSSEWAAKTCSNGRRVTAVWLDNMATVEVPGVPVEKVWGMWQNKEEIPRWMPWITSVKVQKEDPKMSKWTLSTFQFGQQLQFSWMARDLTPVQLKKIHWVSDGGLPNRGSVQFLDKGADGCAVRLTISYELPEVLRPIGEGVKPVVENILLTDMKRFAKLALEEHGQQAGAVGGGSSGAAQGGRA